MLEQTGQEPITLGGPSAAGAGPSNVQNFLGSQAYKDFQAGQAGQMGTMDMYNSPYFGSMSSGSSGRAQDKAYEQWLASNSAGGAPATPGAPTPVGAATTGLDPSQSTLSPNFASYVYNMLGKGEAAANQPFQPFTGERFAGPSALQQQAFQGIAGLQVPGQIGQASGIAGNVASTATGLAYNPQKFDTGLGAIGSVSDYMSPYTSGVTDIAAREARRQADISRNAEQGRLSQAGAYGGSRQAIMEAERQRNLGTQIEDIGTKGLQSAYDRAVAQRQQEATLGLEAQKSGEQSRQFGANYGLQGLDKQIAAAQTLGSLGGQEQQAQTGLSRLQLEAGETQQKQAQNPLDFGYQQWQESLKHPYQQASYMQSLLQGMPVQARAYDSGQSGSAGALQGGISALALYQMLMGKNP